MLRSDFTVTNIPKAADIRNELLALRANLNPKVANYPGGVSAALTVLDDIRTALGGSALTPPTAADDTLDYIILPTFQRTIRAIRTAIGDVSVTGNVSAIQAPVKTAFRVQINDILIDAGWS